MDMDMEAEAQKSIDLNKVQEIPDSHVWKPMDDDDEDDSAASVVADASLPPVIDLNGPNVMEEIREACKRWGVFQITNHGVPARLMEEMEGAAKSLFALPLDQKQKAARAPGILAGPGYGPFHYSSFFPKLMWYEGFTIVGSPIQHARKLWPHDYHMFCQVVEKYEKEMEKLAERLIWLLLGSLLGIAKEDIDWAAPKPESANFSPCSALQLNYYPVCPDPGRAMGFTPHTDSTIFTILYQNQVSGLQVRPENGGWVTVPPVPGAYVVNVGDLLHILSNGSYQSVLHRVLVNQTTNRLSIVYFNGVPDDVKVSPFSKLVDSTHPVVYKTVNWKEYLDIKEKVLNNALASIQVDSKGELVHRKRSSTN